MLETISKQGIAAFIAVSMSTAAVMAQNVTQIVPGQLSAYSTAVPWTSGAPADAKMQSVAGATIPMSTYSIVATKDNKTYTGTMVGTSPFGPMSGSVIDAVVVPLIVKLGSNTFDPTLPDPCDSYVPAMTRFKQSPLTPILFT